jgi:hypothetical protein
MEKPIYRRGMGSPQIQKYSTIKVDLPKNSILVDLTPNKIGESIPEAHYDFDPSFDNYLARNKPEKFENYNLDNGNLDMPQNLAKHF